MYRPAAARTSMTDRVMQSEANRPNGTFRYASGSEVAVATRVRAGTGSYPGERHCDERPAVAVPSLGRRHLKPGPRFLRNYTWGTSARLRRADSGPRDPGRERFRASGYKIWKF